MYFYSLFQVSLKKNLQSAHLFPFAGEKHRLLPTSTATLSLWRETRKWGRGKSIMQRQLPKVDRLVICRPPDAADTVPRTKFSSLRKCWGKLDWSVLWINTALHFMQARQTGNVWRSKQSLIKTEAKVQGCWVNHTQPHQTSLSGKAAHSVSSAPFPPPSAELLKLLVMYTEILFSKRTGSQLHPNQ